ncbi:MAG: YcxB family protein [Burkholderiales bacterium]|jgi:hypothetical protein|nr:YcxB family protein [Burkholderiales bacterium]
MPEPMQARFHINERDYLRAAVLHARLTPRRWVVLALLLVLLLGWVLAVGTLFDVWAVAIGVSVGCVVILLALRFIVNPLVLRWHYRRYKAIHKEQTITLLDEGVRFDSSNGSSLLTWDLILRWRYNADYVLIYLMPRLFHVVPSTVAAGGFDMERLKADLMRHVGPTA